jgi:ribulose-5-phosphate 4-epimerase/fuculose-1-phosphate aldolase
MPKLADLIEDLVTANHILAKLGIVDTFGHVSLRHPDNPKHYLLSCSRAPELVKTADIMEFTLEGDPVDAQGRKPYVERFIHGAATRRGRM